MGLTKVTLEITNPDDPKKSLKDEFLVDSGAFYTVLPKKMVDKLGLKAEFKQDFSLLVLGGLGLILDPFQRKLHPAKLVL